MVRAQSLFVDYQCASIKRLGLGVPFGGGQEVGKAGQLQDNDWIVGYVGIL